MQAIVNNIDEKVSAVELLLSTLDDLSEEEFLQPCWGKAQLLTNNRKLTKLVSQKKGLYFIET